MNQETSSSDIDPSAERAQVKRWHEEDTNMSAWPDFPMTRTAFPWVPDIHWNEWPEEADYRWQAFCMIDPEDDYPRYGLITAHSGRCATQNAALESLRQHIYWRF